MLYCGKVSCAWDDHQLSTANTVGDALRLLNWERLVFVTDDDEGGELVETALRARGSRVMARSLVP